jgi:hypothetical protein
LVRYNFSKVELDVSAGGTRKLYVHGRTPRRADPNKTIRVWMFARSDSGAGAMERQVPASEHHAWTVTFSNPPAHFDRDKWVVVVGAATTLKGNRLTWAAQLKIKPIGG